MADNVFDPSKLNLDLDADTTKQDEKIEEKNEEIIESFEKKEEQIILETIIEKEETKDSLDSFLSDLEQVNTKSEEKIEEKDILSDISTIVTDPSLLSSEQKAEIQSHKEEVLDIIPEKQTIVFDMNVTNIDDLIKINLEKWYDFFIIEPKDDFVRVSFRKDWLEKESKNIKFPIYSNFLIKAKTLAKMNLEVSNIEQKWETEYQLLWKNIKLTIKTVPTSLGEKFFLKSVLSENKSVKAVNKNKSNISLGQAASFLWVVFVIALILGSAFLTFVVMNANTVDDVNFFRGLGVNLSDINNFLQKLSTIVFSILLFIETIFLVSFIFKALITKKEFKKLKTKYTIMSIFFLVISFSTASAWMLVDKKIKSLPNWQEEIFGDIQMLDNDKLLSSKYFDRASSVIQDASNLIWPVTIKYDLTRFWAKQAKNGFTITKFIWDFGNWDKEESLNSEFLKTFDKVWVYNIKLTAEWTDINWEVKVVPVQNIPSINVTSLLKIDENIMPSGWKTVVFDASSLKSLWELQWYLEDDLSKPIFTGPVFRPSKVFFDQALVWLYIKREWKKDEVLDKVFLITWDNAANIEWQIKYEQSETNELDFNLKVENPKADFWNGFIKQFKWEIWSDVITKDADLNNLSESSQITYSFKDYWDKQVKVTLIDSAWKMKQIVETIKISKQVKMKNKLDIQSEGASVEYEYNDLNKEYTIKSLGTPTILNIDARSVKTEDSIYILKEVTWDTNGDWKTDKTGKELELAVNTPGIINVWVEYTFFRINKKTDEIKVKEMINIEAVEKDENLSLKITQDSEYAPTKVAFDASSSKIKWEDIVKFAYDYWDWSPVDIRDAINPGHIYTKDWDYTVKLTVTTSTWKQHSIEKKVIIKPAQKTAKISVSMKETNVWQTISFESKDSVGQISTYSWDFGDWEISSEANPSHAYKKSWTYKVKLTLDFADNNQMTEETEITIND